jgi:hypothetical protein
METPPRATPAGWSYGDDGASAPHAIRRERVGRRPRFFMARLPLVVGMSLVLRLSFSTTGMPCIRRRRPLLGLVLDVNARGSGGGFGLDGDARLEGGPLWS